MYHQGHSHAKEFFGGFNSDSYDTIVKYTTFFQDDRWKRQIIMRTPDRSFVLDLGCGTGILSEKLVKRNNFVIGLDLTIDYLIKGKSRNNFIANGSAEMLPFREISFDAVVSSYLAKYVDSSMLVNECWRVLKSGGIAIFHDFTYPENKMVNYIWNVYFDILRIAGRIVKSWQVVFDKLDTFIANSRWLERINVALENRGFVDIEIIYQTMKTSAIITARKP